MSRPRRPRKPAPQQPPEQPAEQPQDAGDDVDRYLATLTEEERAEIDRLIGLSNEQVMELVLGMEGMTTQEIARWKATQALLSDFAAYLRARPQLRFWQALCNWAGVSRIGVQRGGSDADGTYLDTFYWETKDH